MKGIFFAARISRNLGDEIDESADRNED